jgi:hypothetical protein
MRECEGHWGPTARGEEKNTQSFGEHEGDHFGDVDMDGRIILK